MKTMLPQELSSFLEDDISAIGTLPVPTVEVLSELTSAECHVVWTKAGMLQKSVAQLIKIPSRLRRKALKLPIDVLEDLKRAHRWYVRLMEALTLVLEQKRLEQKRLNIAASKDDARMFTWICREMMGNEFCDSIWEKVHAKLDK